MSLAALLFILQPELFIIVLVGRFIAGIGYGLVYIALIQHYGEITCAKRRGRVGTTIHLFLLKGGLISGPVVIEIFNQTQMNVNRFFGIISISLSSIAIVMTVIFYKESPLQLILNGRDREAREMLILLNGESIETSDEISQHFNDLKSIVEEDKFSSACIFTSGNRQQLLKVLWLRFAFVLSYNDALKRFIHITIIMCNIQYISGSDTADDNNGESKIQPISFVLNLIHTWVVVFALFTIDRVGKRAYFLISGFATSLILLIFGAYRATWAHVDNNGDSVFDNTNSRSAHVALILTILVTFDIFSALGFGSTANIYSTEAFQTSKQSGSVAFTCIFEYSLQILFVIIRHLSIEHSRLLDVALLLSSGLSLLTISLYLMAYLPETKQLSLRDARHLLQT